MKPLNYLNGEWLQGQGETLEALNPFTGEAIFQGQMAGLMQVIPALAKANEAQEKSQKNPKPAQLLMKFLELVERDFETWAQQEAQATGLSSDYLLNSVKPKILQYCKWRLENLPPTEEYFPIGLQGIILPAVGALECAISLTLESLLGGNAVLLLPSKRGLAGVKTFVESMEKMDLLPCLLNCVVVSPQDRELVLQHPALRQVVLVGRPATGKKVEQLLSNTEKKYVGIYGGKNSALVLADANIDESVRSILKGAFTASGGLGVSLSRVLVAQKIFEEFQTALTEQMRQLSWGDPGQNAYGVLANENVRDRVNAVAPQLLEDEGQLLEEKSAASASSQNGSSKFAIYRHVSFCSEWQQQPIDAPVLLLNDFKYNHEAVKWANTTPYGLTASVFTSERDRFLKVAQKLEVSQVSHNQWIGDSQLLPVIGAKSSSRGVTGGNKLQDIFISYRNYL